MWLTEICDFLPHMHQAHFSYLCWYCFEILWPTLASLISATNVGFVHDCLEDFTVYHNLAAQLQCFTCTGLSGNKYMSTCQALFTKAVLSKFQNPGLPDRPPMMAGWVVRITFGWSVDAVVRNGDETLIHVSLLCCLLSTITRAYIPRSC